MLSGTFRYSGSVSPLYATTCIQLAFGGYFPIRTCGGIQVPSSTACSAQ